MSRDTRQKAARHTSMQGGKMMNLHVGFERVDAAALVLRSGRHDARAEENKFKKRSEGGRDVKRDKTRVGTRVGRKKR